MIDNQRGPLKSSTRKTSKANAGFSLLQAAFDVAPQGGFRGGVNIATLHYYLPGKQKLVEGLSHFMSAKFVTLHGLTPKPSGLPALDHLRQKFADGRLYSGRIQICFSS